MSDPGVIVQQRMEQRPQEPVFGEMPAAIIGPIVNVRKEAPYEFKSIDWDEDENGNKTGVNSIENDTIILSEIDDLVDETNDIEIESIKMIDGRGTREPITIDDDFVDVEVGDSDILIKWEDYGVDLVDDLINKFDPMIKETDLDGAEYLIDFKEVREDLADEEAKALEAQGTVGIQQIVGMHYKDNPMGIAGWLADSVAPNTAVYFVPTKDYINDDEVDADSQISLALTKIMNKRVCNVAALAPDDAGAMETIDDLVINHAQMMSDEEESQFRFAWCGIKKPSEDKLDNPKGVLDKKNQEVDLLTSYTQSVYERKSAIMFQGATFDLLDEDDVHLNSSYLAAMTAVFKSSIRPEQGMTRLNVGSPIKELDYKDRYRPSREAELSKGGVWVWKQDNPGENIRCRHQMTTNTLNNRTRQQSVQATLDYISYAFMDTLDLSIGINNVSAGLVDNVRLTSELLIATLIDDGKLRSGSQILEVYEDPNNASRIRVKAELVIPSPLDQIVVTLVF